MSLDLASPDAVTRAALARAQADARLAGAIDDLFLPETARLDEETRLGVARLLADTVAAVEAELRRQAGRLLDGAASLAEGDVTTRLMGAGLLRDEALIATLIAHVRHRAITTALPGAANGEEASLLVRLAAVPDRVVAAAARALLAADASDAAVLPAAVQQRVTWWVAAALRPVAETPAVDQALAEAAVRSLAAQDGGVGAATRLAAAIDARPDELAPLLLEALGDRRLSLFVAVLAHALTLDFADAQALVIEPEGERLWLALRAIGLDRPTIARIALALSDADPRRDIEAFADRLDFIAAVDPDESRRALALDTLAPEFRAAIRALRR